MYPGKMYPVSTMDHIGDVTVHSLPMAKPDKPTTPQSIELQYQHLNIQMHADLSLDISLLRHYP